MFRGHVDQITRRVVVGWAADDASPDQTVDISIFVNGVKAAQLPCDVPRTDLRDVRLYGDGRHGFRYEFPTEIAPTSDVRVTVRFSINGGVLGHGDALLPAGQPSASFVDRRQSDEIFPEVPAPVDQKSLLQIFSVYEDEEGLYDLLARLSFNRDQTARNLHYAVFGEYHSVPGIQDWLPDHLARDLLNDLLYSPRFQQDIIATVLRAFPEKRRLLFVHIPKCAGSDLTVNLAGRYPSIAERMGNLRETGKRELFSSLASLVRYLGFADSIFIRGHVNLSYFTTRQLIRPIDRCFTVVRDPIAMAISQVNYIASKLRWNAEAGTIESDTRAWLNLMNMTELPPVVTDEFARELCRTALQNRDLVIPNPICHWLGGGTAKEVLARLREHDVEVTDTTRYNAWLRQEWRIDAHTRQNESIKFVTLDTLSPREISYLGELTSEDAKLYDVVERSLAAANRPSVTARYLLPG